MAAEGGFRGRLTSLVSNIPSVASVWKGGDAQTMSLASSGVLEIGNALNGIFSSIENASALQIQLPNLVVVGTQSSGKSSVLNGLLRMDILPTGSQMVTRCPLHLQLTQIAAEGHSHAEFGSYADGSWRVTSSLPLTMPAPTQEEVAAVQAEIEAQTVSRAGTSKGVSGDAIVLKVFSPHVPNLSLTDLPGIIMTALTDKGQPKDIKKQIRDVIGTYISREKTIILAVMPARCDLEADPALELVKDHDPTGARTVGVLTKLDLMNEGTDVTDYLANTVSQDLQCTHGYFAVRNRPSTEMTSGGASGCGHTVHEGLAKEADFFGRHAVYGSRKDLSGRIGIPTLGAALSGILVDHIRACLPTIVTSLRTMQAKVDSQARGLGPSLPVDETGQASYVHILLSGLSRRFVAALEERTSPLNTARAVKDVMVRYREDIAAADPFTPDVFSDEYFLDAIRNCEGNHMTFPTPPIEVLEACLKDVERAPIDTLSSRCMDCAQAAFSELSQLLDSLLLDEELSRFPALVRKAKEELYGQLLKGHLDATCAKISELIAMEKSYVWTDDPAFRAELQGLFSKKNASVDPSVMRSLLRAYFTTVKASLAHTVPKAVMHFLVKACEDGMSTHLFERVARPPYAALLQESSDVASKRNGLLEQQSKLRAAHAAVEQISGTVNV